MPLPSQQDVSRSSSGMFGASWPGLPSLFSPVDDSTLVLYGAMVLGVIHLNTGMVVSFLEKKRAGNLADGIFEEGSLWVILVGGVLFALSALGVVNSPVLRTVGLVILIVGSVMLLFGAGRHSKGFGKVTAAFSWLSSEGRMVSSSSQQTSAYLDSVSRSSRPMRLALVLV